jgi:CheY-like chemotaxis protein
MSIALPKHRPLSPAEALLLPPSPKPLIMIVGPSEDTRYMLRVILELWNYEVIEAATPEESLRLGRKRHPSLLLMDTTSDFAGCLDNINKIKHDGEWTTVPSIMMSGYSQETYRDAAIKSGASHYIAKPVDFDLLQTYIETLLNNEISATGN